MITEIRAYLDVGKEAVLLEGDGELNLSVVLNIGSSNNSIRVDSNSGTVEDTFVDLEAVALADVD